MATRVCDGNNPTQTVVLNGRRGDSVQRREELGRTCWRDDKHLEKGAQGGALALEAVGSAI